MPEPVTEADAEPLAAEHARGPDGPRGTADQPPLPFEDDAESRDPIPYALTARARRTVAPATLPDLSVVPEPAPGADDPDPFDPRPARARALRRAGRDVPEIARMLGVDEDLAAAWARTVGPRADRRRARASEGAQVRRLPVPDADQGERRRRGHEQARQHLHGGVPEVIAYLAGRAEVTPHATTFSVADPDEAARIVRWLVDLAGGDPSRARLVLETGRGVAHDLVEARWEQGTGIAGEHIAVSRTAASTEDAVSATLRIADPGVAAVLAGWQDAFMEVSAPARVDA